MIVKVGATKGGVGKTTVALNLALGRALAAEMSGSSMAIFKELPKLQCSMLRMTETVSTVGRYR